MALQSRALSRTVTLTLVPTESYVVAQFIRFLVPEQHPRVSWQFLLAFGVAYLHHTEETLGLLADEEAEDVPVGEDDILALRELIPVTASVGSKAVGLSIHRKLYTALLQLHPEEATELHFSYEEGPTREALDTRFRALKRRKGRASR